MGYSALTARDLDTMPGNAGSQSGLKTTLTQGRKDDELQTKLNNVFTLQAEQADWLKTSDEEIDEPDRKHIQLHGKDSGGSPAESVPTVRPLNDMEENKTIPYDTSDPANRFAPDGEEIVTLSEESRSKLDKDKIVENECFCNSHHDACVSRYLKDVKARDKKPQAVAYYALVNQ
ncbi:hypothetical protein Tco_0264518 [Tanacetum coccineum]